MASYTAGNFLLSGFSAASASGGYNSGYTAAFYYIDPNNSDDGGTFGFNDASTVGTSQSTVGSQIVSASGSNDAWTLAVTINHSTNSGGDYIAYGAQDSSATLAQAGPGFNNTLTFTGTGSTQLTTLIQGLNVESYNALRGDTVGITFDLLDGGGAVTGTSTTTESLFTAYFAACYAVGTAIATPQGEVLIENLRMGDLVVTTDGSAQKVKWVGRRSYTAAEIAAHAQLRPVMIRRGALADNMPHRDLTVSPMHGLFIDETFIPAAALVNNVSILRVDELAPVSYIHIELDSHAAIFAEGAPAETFVDDNSRMIFDNADEFYDMFGAEAPRAYPARRLEEGYQLEAIRRRLSLRAGATQAAVTSGTMQGHVERMSNGVVEGWVLDQSGSAPVELEVLADGEVFATVLANRYRIDLDHAGLAGGRCGFTVTMPASVTDLGQVEVRRVVDGAALAMPKVTAFAV